MHLTTREKEVADARQGGAFVGRRRYRPQQWDEVADWRLYPFGGGERWFGFDAVRGLDGLPPEILLVPLAGQPGVTRASPCRRMAAAGYSTPPTPIFNLGEIGSETYQCTPGLRSYQALMEVDRKARLANQKKLRRLSVDHQSEVRIFCAHDVVEFELLAGSG